MSVTNVGLFAQIAKKAILGDGEGTTLWEKWTKKYDEKNIPRVDENLPLGIKIGSMIELDLLAAFILGEGDYLTPQFSGKGEVYAFGKINAHDSFEVVRFYVRSINNDFNDYFLEFGLKNGEILSIILYSLYQELDLVESADEPVNADGKAALNHWLGDNSPLIGSKDFTIFMQDGRQIDYIRIDSPNENRVIRTEEKEIIYDEPKDTDLEHITNIVGEYARAVDNTAFGNKEILIARLSELKDSAYIQIFIGVEINKNQIRII